MCILITGGAGYVGSHTARMLDGLGFPVVLFDNLSSGYRRNLLWGEFVQGDVTDTLLLRDVIRRQKVIAVLHLAASAHVAESIRHPERYFANNVQGSISVLDAMLAENVRAVVFASSSSVYGNCHSAKLREHDYPVPVSPYGESKLQTERMLRWYAQAHGVSWTALRYFNVAGSEGGFGEDLTSSTRLIPRVVSAACGGGDPVRIFGTDFPTDDGSAVRDYVHVSDVARANVAALREVMNGRSGEVINIGSGKGTSVLGIVEKAAELCNRPVPHCRVERRSGDPGIAIADITRARHLLGWTPQQSELQTILASVIREAPEMCLQFPAESAQMGTRD